MVSITTLLGLMKSNPTMGPLKFFITTKWSAKVLSPIENLSVTVDIGFSNWPFATCIRKLGGSSILRMLMGACCLILCNSVWVIALTWAPESTRKSIVKPFLKYRGKYSISLFHFKTIVEDSGM